MDMGRRQNEAESRTVRRPGIYDYQLCADDRELQETLKEINQSGYVLISVTQNDWTYTVFFWRPDDG